MESSMMELLFGKEALERAKKRGRAYMCVACHNLTGERRTGELGLMQDHVLKTHVSRDRVPFYCRLCTFKCQTKQQMDHHTRHYSRHVTMAKFRGIVNHEEWQIQSPAPYQIGEKDLLKFSQAESILFFLGKQSPGAMGEMDLAVSGNPEEELSSETLQQGYISIPEDPVAITSGVQPIQGHGTSVGQLVGQQSLVASSFSPALQEIRGLAQQVTTTPRLPVPLQINTSTNYGPQRNFSSMAQNGMMQGAVMAVTPPGSFHHSPVSSPGFQSPEPSMSHLEAYQTAVTAQYQQPVLQPPVVLTAPLAKHVGTSPTMAAHPVNPPTRLVMASAMQSGTAVSVSPSPGVSFASVAGTSARTQEIEEKMAAQCPQLPPQQQVALTPRTTRHVSTSNTATSYPVISQPVTTGAIQHTTVASVVPSPSLAGGDGTGRSIEMVQAAEMPETISSTRETGGDEQFPPEEPAAKEGTTEEVENLWPQLMPQEDSDQLSEVESQYGAEGLKRKTAERKEDKTEMDRAKGDDGQADVEPNPKRQRTDREEPVFEVSMVALNGLTTAIQRLSGEVTRTRENHEKTERVLVDVTCALSKCTDAIDRFKNVLEENAKEERRREERWIEMDRVREEERRKDREAEQRREVRRREAERKDREELRKLLTEMKEETKSRQKGDKAKDGEEKENSKSLKSVLGKSYTENSIKDLSKRK